MPIDTVSMPVDETMSFDNTMSIGNTMSMTMPFVFGDTDHANLSIFAMSMPTCDATYTCPAAGSCNCGGNIQNGVEEICGCYTITSVNPPFDTSSIPAKGTWYCYEVYLDKSVAGCSSAKAVSHAVLPTGFSESCHFHQGGQDSAGSDNWSDHTCDNASGLKFDFGHEGGGNKVSVTYCIDVSCENAPAGEGSINWVFKAGNDRCESQVTEGAIPNCGVSSDLCHPSCPADDSSGSGGGNGGNGGNGGGPKKLNNGPAESEVASGSESNKSWTPVVASIVGVAGVVALAGVTYRVVAQKNAAATAAAGGDASSLSSVDTHL